RVLVKDDLHVLLRHRLLRRSHGFEGVLTVNEIFDPRDQTVVEMEHVEQPPRHLNATYPRVAGEADSGDNGVAVHADGLWVVGEVVRPRLEVARHEAAQLVAPAALLGVGERWLRSVYDL